MGIGGLVLSNGSVSLRCVAPANIYSMPGTVALGLSLCCAKSLFHRQIDTDSGGAPAPLPGSFGPNVGLGRQPDGRRVRRHHGGRDRRSFGDNRRLSGE